MSINPLLLSKPKAPGTGLKLPFPGAITQAVPIAYSVRVVICFGCQGNDCGLAIGSLTAQCHTYFYRDRSLLTTISKLLREIRNVEPARCEPSLSENGRESLLHLQRDDQVNCVVQ
jgi:hypothetical protein